jgi:hypothetical protein
MLPDTPATRTRPSPETVAAVVGELQARFGNRAVT